MVRLAGLLVLVCFSHLVFAQSVTVDFDNPRPPGGRDSFVQGDFGGIDWGSNGWRWTGPYGPNRSNHVYFGSGSGTSRTIGFPGTPRILVSLDVYALSNGTLTLTDGQGQSVSQFISTGGLQTVTTGWLLPSSTITINFTAGWELGADNFVHVDGAPPPPPPSYPLQITPIGTGTGLVTSAPAGIDCGLDCVNDYEEGTVVTLTATPVGDATFEGWTGDADCADGQVTMNLPVACTAEFSAPPPPPAQFTLAVALQGTGGGTVISVPAGLDCGLDCQEDYNEGTQVVLTPQPDAVSAFAGWSGDADCADGAVTLLAPTNCIATFTLLPPPPPPEYTLQVQLLGTGGGLVSSSPAGISCGSDCQELFVENTQVVMSAVANMDSEFVSWTGDNDCADGVVAMTANVACSATFDLLPVPTDYLLTVATAGDGGGTVTSAPAGIDCGIDCQELFPEGTPVVLTAAPAADSEFAGWTGASDCADGVVAMNSDVSCSATFTLLPAPVQYNLSVALQGDGIGVVTSAPAGIDCGGDCQESFPESTQVQLAALPGADSEFTGWSGDADCADGVVAMNSDVSCSATFTLLPAPVQYNLSVSLQGDGIGVVTSSPAGIDCGGDCQESFQENTQVQLAALPGADSEFAGWSGDADCADGAVGMVADTTCTATFTLLPQPTQYSLTIALQGDGSGTVTSAPAGIDCGVDCQESYLEDTQVVLSPVPGADSEFAGWAGASDCADGVVEMTADVACTATFTLLPQPTEFTLSVTLLGTGNGIVTSSPAGIDCGVDCQELFLENTQVALSAQPSVDSEFVGWAGDTDCADGVVAMTGDIVCSANFAELPPPPPEFSLTVAVSGTGGGTVTSSPAGIDCGLDCQSFYEQGLDVVLDPAPDPFSRFVGWRGDADCSDGIVTMNQDVDCVADFDLPGGGAGSALRFFGLGTDARDRDRVKFLIDDFTNPADPPFPLDVGGTDFTIEFWMRANSAENTAGPVSCGANSNWITGNTIVDRDRFNRPLAFGLSIAGGRLVFGVTGAGNQALTICGTADVLDDAWHHVAIQRSAIDGQMEIYVDGILDATGQGPAGDISYPDDAVPGNFCGVSGNQSCTDSDPYLVIGAEKHDAGPQFPAYAGFFDELRISRVLRYQAGFLRPIRPFVRDPDTLGLYHFDEGAGEVVRDDIAPSDGARDGVVRFGGDGTTYGPIWVSSDAPLDQ